MAKDPFNRTAAPTAPAAADPFPAQVAAPPPTPGPLPKATPRAATPVKLFKVAAPNPGQKDACWRPQIRGTVVSLYPGKILRSTNYDIEDLKRQGVPLEECEARPLAAG